MKPSDLAGVVELAVSSGLFPVEEVGVVQELLAEHVAGRTPLHVCLVDDDDGLQGVAYYQPAHGVDGTWYLLMIGVTRAEQGRGRGAALMHEVERDLRNTSQRLLLVETSGVPEFAMTRLFYLGLGYEEEARVRDYYAPGDDMVLYRKALETS